jgi:hypothetical protein
MIRIRRIHANNFKQLQTIDLTLPERGRILVGGLNEAGKSTLFEAIFFALFGQPLATETAGGKLDDLIRYDAEEAFVGLELVLAGGRGLSVARRVRRGRPNVWELDITQPDGRVEEIRANRAVNERVEAELGFDGEALLNTCFVEQKKLEKLEGMTLAQREDSLMKLLNLDRLRAVGERLRVRPADRAAVTRLQGRAALARLQAERPVIEARHAELTRLLDRLEVHAGLGRASAGLRDLAELTADLARDRTREAEVAERAAAAEALAAGLVTWRQGSTAREQAAEAEAALARIEADLAAVTAARDVELPAVDARGRALKRLKNRLAWLGSLAAERSALDAQITARDAELRRLAEDRAALNQVRHELVEARGAAREALDTERGLEQDLRAFEVRTALAEWVAAQDARRALGQPSQEIETTRQARAAAGRRLQLELMGIFAGMILVNTMVLINSGLLGLVLTTTLGMGIFFWRGWICGRHIQDLTLMLGRLEGEAAVADREAERLAEREAAAAARIGALNAVRPADRQRAGMALAELDQRMGERTRGDVETALRVTREQLARATVETETLGRREAALRDAAGRADGAALGAERDRWMARTARLEAVLTRREPQARDLATALAVPADASVIDGELGVLRAEHRALRDLAARAADLERERTARIALVERHNATARAAWAALPDAATGEVAGDAVPDASAWEATEEAAGDAVSDALAWESAGAALREAYEAAGGDTVRQALDAATRATAELTGRRSGAERALGLAITGLASRMAEVGLDARSLRGIALATDADLEGARAALDAARAAADPGSAVDPGALAAERDQLRARIDVVRHEIARLGRELGLPGEVLDPVHTAAEHQAAARELAVRERGYSIVEHAGRNVVRRVLPSTLLHMRRLLPILTGGRYFDAVLSDDYRIEVYDDRAGTWKKKNIFSGGTRDQLSLALRLAFALATLPEERGAAPSFLFLDEPLGAFDDERARALVDLLTEGEIAESFDQIFLISHVRVDPALFDYHVTLAGGRVVESDLPMGAAGGDPAE